MLVYLVVIGLFGLKPISAESGRCLQPLDPGPCQFFQRRFYFDRSKQQCLSFNYGGCLGNGNRFSNERECTQECIYQLKDQTKMPEICLMRQNAGECSKDAQANGQIWYYFNSEMGLCEQFLYFGCAAGNQNRFYSLYQCKSVCGERFDPQIACERCDARTSICQAISKYSYACECRQGYLKTEQGECVDMDECDLMQAKCHEKSYCINTVGSYRCECIQNYVGDGKKECMYVGPATRAQNCVDCHANAKCLNDKCRCQVGFEGDGLNCTDVNECENSEWPCDVNARCFNTPGSFYCECLEGFAGNGRRCTKDPLACLERFDRRYQMPCIDGNEWHIHYYLDHTTKQCDMFWYNGCPSESRNIFSDMQTCETMCTRPNLLAKPDQCWDKFDATLRNQCARGEWQQRYFYDHSSMTCQLFWYDGCRSSSRNMFDDLLTCQWLCEEQPRYKTRACLETFDEHYRDECNGGLWRQNYYFDKQKMKCMAFWYDGCTSTSANLFPDHNACVQTCEVPVKESITHSHTKSMHWPFTSAPKHSISHAHRHHAHRPTSSSQAITYLSRQKAHHPSTKIYDHKLQADNRSLPEKPATPNVIENICEQANPCQNNATCVYDKLKKSYHCECTNGYTNRNCTELDDHNMCAKQPCKNGGTCIGKQGGLFDCFCASGFGGATCQEQPCKLNPCSNNGTCRTTKDEPFYFCECSSKWGGKTCSVEIPSTNTRKYGKNVQLLSSGKPEWIENLRKHKMREKKPTTSMESSLSNYTEPDGDLNLLNGTEKQQMKSRTLRLPAGSTTESGTAISQAGWPSIIFSPLAFVLTRLLLFHLPNTFSNLL